ncbi:MAG: protoporphyrinogen oxidase [Planctomycetes bacterium]|nr:protoporphyrinogen oxidase [Planctomycetota bacterium]
MDDHDLLIAGAGAAGLARAWFRLAAAPSLRLCVAEAAPRAGGWMRSVPRDGYLCEAGPQGFRPNEATDELCAALGVAGDVVPAAAAAQRRWVLLRGRMVALPAGPGQFLASPLLSFGDKLRLFGEPWRRRGDDPEESMADFLVRRFGRGTRPLAEALAHGIFAGDAARLEMASMFPLLTELEQRHGSVVRGLFRRKRDRSKPRVQRPVLCSFRGGMAGLADRFVRELGDRLLLGTPVQSLQKDGDHYVVGFGGARPRSVRAREVALALPSAAAAALVAGFDPALAADLQQIRSASVASVYLGAPRERFAHPLDGFGCLAPKHDSPLLGVLLCSSVFPDHAPRGHALLRVMTGGAEHPREIDRSDAELCAQAAGHARALFGLSGEPTFLHVERCRDAIAQFEKGHRARLERIGARLSHHPGLSLLGACYRQIAVVGQWTAEGSRP